MTLPESYDYKKEPKQTLFEKIMDVSIAVVFLTLVSPLLIFMAVLKILIKWKP